MGWGCEFDEDIILKVKNIYWRVGSENTVFCSKQFRRSRSLKDKFQEEHFRRTGKGENTFSFQFGYIIDGRWKKQSERHFLLYLGIQNMTKILLYVQNTNTQFVYIT